MNFECDWWLWLLISSFAVAVGYVYFRSPPYLDIRADCCAISNPWGISQSHVRVGSAELCSESGRAADGQHRDDDHDDHDEEADHNSDGDGQHLVVVPRLLLHLSFSDLLYRLVEGLDQEVERVAPAVLVLAPHVHLVCGAWLKLPHLEGRLAALDCSDQLTGQPRHR